MDCFNHHDKQAIGVCKACGKGLCPDCVVDPGHGVSCKGNHEEIVQDYHMMNQYHLKTLIHKVRNKILNLYTFIFLLTLLIVGSFQLWSAYTKDNGSLNFSVIMGTIFVFLSLLILIGSIQPRPTLETLPKNKKSDSDEGM